MGTKFANKRGSWPNDEQGDNGQCAHNAHNSNAMWAVWCAGQIIMEMAHATTKSDRRTWLHARKLQMSAVTVAEDKLVTSVVTLATGDI